MKTTCGNCGCGCAHDSLPCAAMVGIFQNLEPPQLEDVMNTVFHREIAKGELLFHYGDPARTLDIVRKGKIRLFSISESGKEKLIRILNPGDWMGEAALFGEHTQSHYAEAMMPTSICSIDRESFQKLLVRFPDISLRLLETLSLRLLESEKQSSLIATESISARVAMILLEYGDAQKSAEIQLPMSKKDLASYIGTTAETLSRKLALFERKGLIRLRTGRRIELLDADELRKEML